MVCGELAPHVVVFSIDPPGFDGLDNAPAEMCRRLRARPATKTIEIVSKAVTQDLDQRLRQAGADRCVPKAAVLTALVNFEQGLFRQR